MPGCAFRTMPERDGLTMDQSVGRGVGMLFFLLGLFILAAGGYYAFESLMLVQNGRESSGVVVGFHEQVSEDQQVRYAPIIEYQVGSQTYRFASASYANSPAYAIGESLALRYDPERPDQARLDRFGTLWGLPLGLGAAGFLVLLVGAGMFFRKR